ncbi:putative bifunctional diguanylate cyclase/phosphodiesterase, partial [Bradyrhizobium sp.]|uniref:putative bifunctional diguanylate cyclase/phosphodiesterase n=1 Tax=Bradyrhizobium sp. TaxID=376 RepID=UPI003C25413B
VGTSIGIALCPEHGRVPADLMRKADLALYATKAAGRNDFRIYDTSMSASDDDQKARELDLRDALQREEFELHYQPVVELATGAVCAAEALVRWRHPIRGLISPDEFIPLAESTGLIVPMGEWILQKACSDAASWKEPLKVAVNISAIQFTKSNLFDVVLCTLVDTGLPPARLELELTESVLLDHEGNHAQTIRQLRNVGITMVMDDFGTGYSSATYLTNFAFGKIKLDKSFVQGMATRKECAAVVASMLALAKGLGIETTAEGVETSEQMELLRAAGVTYGQGYYFGRPQRSLAMDAPSHLHRHTA